MVAEEVISLFNSVKGIGQVGIFDFADKLNAILSVQLVIICTLVVTVKQYFQEPLSCYTATPAEGNNLQDYINNYCWVEGTVALPVNEVLQVTEEEWVKYYKNKVVYYQWVPFVLALQAVLFIIPRFIWMSLTYNRTGTSLEQLITTASQGASEDPDEQGSKIEYVTNTIKNVIFVSREVNQGKMASLRKKTFNLFQCFTFSKRMGTWVVAVYFFMKLIYLGNGVGQVYLMQHFLGLDKNYTSYFGYEITKDIINGRDWSQTKVFPRVTFCRVELQHVGAVNKVTSQCVLGVNFINEKIYIFLWYWMVLVTVFTLFSIPIWLLRLTITGNRIKFIKRNLILSGNFEETDRKLIGPFTRLFLRHDGVFILKMLALNAGDYITSEVIGKLFRIYKDSLVGRTMFDDRRFAEFEDDDMLPLTSAAENGGIHRRDGKLASSEC